MTGFIIIVLLIVLGVGLVAVLRSASRDSAPADGSPRSSGKSCPACGDDLPRDRDPRIDHLSRHTRAVEQDGKRGYLWVCRDLCGHSDRFWSTPSDAALAMTAHLMERHMILPS